MIWQAFIEEIETGTHYKNFLTTLYGETPKISYSWHVGIPGSEVSPHVDSKNKMGTHIFYFNTSEDWNPAWGGELIVLGNKISTDQNPEFEHFGHQVPISIVDNRSFVFKNNPEAWHGVKKLVCPEGAYRRLFNVILKFDRPVKTKQKKVKKPAGLLQRLKKFFIPFFRPQAQNLGGEARGIP